MDLGWFFPVKIDVIVRISRLACWLIKRLLELIMHIFTIRNILLPDRKKLASISTLRAQTMQISMGR